MHTHTRMHTHTHTRMHTHTHEQISVARQLGRNLSPHKHWLIIRLVQINRFLSNGYTNQLPKYITKKIIKNQYPIQKFHVWYRIFNEFCNYVDPARCKPQSIIEMRMKGEQYALVALQGSPMFILIYTRANPLKGTWSHLVGSMYF